MKMIFMGRKDYSAKLLEWTLNQGIEVVAVCTDNQFPNSPTAAKAKEFSIPVISMEEAEQMLMKGADVDLVVSYLFWRKIRKPLIDLPRYGCINFHPAILPDWRGTAGYNVAILYRLTEWGATAHYVDENIDTGRIIRVSRFQYDPDTATVVTLEKKTQEIQMELYKEIVTEVRTKGFLPATEQNMSDGRYISRAEMEAMKTVDLEHDTPEMIERKIRAFWFPPYDGANITIGGKRFTLVDENILKTLVGPNTTALV